MKERPILFSAPMVRALLANMKTQTRRVMKPQPPMGWFQNTDELNDRETMEWLLARCPYGVTGDQLWVRESFRLAKGSESVGHPHDVAVFCADGALTVLDTWPWKREVMPAIHMPRGLRRITLAITGVRVERLQDISEADAKAEGVDGPTSGEWPAGFGSWTHGGRLIDGRPWAHRFLQLWMEINGSDSAHANPWVWVLELARVES